MEQRLIEHPLDFEWPFSLQGVARICDEIENFKLKQNTEILCLGCQSVYFFGTHNLRHLTFRLWDKNTPLKGQMEETRGIFRMDLIEVMSPSHTADIGVIDPPWYNEFYRLFIWAAFKNLPLGGRILLSFPPEGTRSSATDDLHSLIGWCSLHRLQFEARHPNCLPYRSPLFEVNALRELGVSNFPLNWRRGDLIILSKRHRACFPKPDYPLPSEKWEEIRIGASRIKICLGKKCNEGLFRGVGRTEVLPSVSSRHKLRRLANVVTSGSRFIRTQYPDKVLDCFVALEASGPDCMCKGFVASKYPLLMRRVSDLIYKEEREAAEYFRRTHEF